MTYQNLTLRFALLACTAAIATPATANSAAPQQDAPQQGVPSRVSAANSDAYARFKPRTAVNPTSIDYSHWDEALEYFVYRMGRSARTAAPILAPGLGTRLIYGHDSRLRLEGNRVAFSMLEPEQVRSLTEYRQDLENTASLVDISALPRNEQLAYWMNLHNVAVIEQIALAYPLRQPSRMQVGTDGKPLDEAKFITVAGVALSPRDIRTKIVFPNWQDPRVIYGFFRGEIGGPTIQRQAFNADNLTTLLNASTVDFVNSLRGTEKRGKTLHVSKIYDEAAPFFFADLQTDLRAHLLKFSTGEVKIMIGKTTGLKPSIYEADVSDLAGGEIDPEYGYVSTGFDPKGWGFDVGKAQTPPRGFPRNIGRLVMEKREKYRKLLKDGKLEGNVIVLDPNDEGELGQEVQ